MRGPSRGGRSCRRLNPLSGEGTALNAVSSCDVGRPQADAVGEIARAQPIEKGGGENRRLHELGRDA